jgi:hypothetical protein
MSAETPTGGTTQPTEAYRDGDALLVRRGADVSHTCIRCAKPAVGEPMVRRFASDDTWDPNVRGGGAASAIGELVFALLMLLSFTSAVAEEKKAMNRLSFKFGLCAAHRRLLPRPACVPRVAKLLRASDHRLPRNGNDRQPDDLIASPALFRPVDFQNATGVRR